MKYFSTRDENHKVSAAEAISRGLAPDGGLFQLDPVALTRADVIRILEDSWR